MSPDELRTSNRKRKRIPRWLRIVLVGVALVVALGLILPYFLEVDRYRTLLASIIERETGRKVTIGKIRVRLIPRAGFVVDDFRLGNPPGFAAGDVLAVEAIRGNLAWRPLLRREVQLSSVELVRPKLILLEDDRGRANYSFGAEASPAAAKNKGAREPAAGTAFQLSDIARVVLTDAELMLGRVSGRSPNIIPSVRARKINAALSRVALDPRRLKQWQGDLPLSGVLLELSGWKEPITFHSGRLKLRDARIESEFRAGVGKAAEVKGNLRVADIERGVADFELSTSKLDVDELMLMWSGTTSPRRPAPAGDRELVAQGRLTAERLQWQPYMANNGTAEIRIFTDRVELWPITIEFYGGTLQLSGRADRTQRPTRFSSNVQVRNLDVGKALGVTDPALRGKTSGTGELDLQLFGALSADWRKGVSGTGRFAIRDGRLPGIDLAGSLGPLARLSGKGGATPFSLLQGDLSISQARVTSRQVHMDSPQGTVDLRGSLGFDGALDYEGQAVLVPGASAGGQTPADAIADIVGGVLKRNVSRATVPFSIRGTFREPKILPGRGLPTIERPAPSNPPGQPAQSPQQKSILDLFRRP